MFSSQHRRNRDRQKGKIMRKEAIMHAVCLLSTAMPVTQALCQSPGHNYVMTETPLDEAGANRVTAVEYMDGLGRPVETVTDGLGTDGSFITAGGTRTCAVTYYDTRSRAVDVRRTFPGGETLLSRLSYSFTDKPVREVYELRHSGGTDSAVVSRTYSAVNDALLHTDVSCDGGQKLRLGNTKIPRQITEVVKNWGIWDYLSTPSMAKQFVGSYSFDSYTSNDGKHLLNIVYDTKSFRSLVYHLPGSDYFNHSRNSGFKPLATTYQFYIWKSKK